MVTLVNYCGGTVYQHKSSIKMYSNYTPKINRSKPNIGNQKLDEDYYARVGLKKEMIPNHVAIILDGSRRWLKAQGKPLNYQPFFEANTLFADLCLKWGVGTATSFVYSLKNLNRGKEANDLIFGQLETYLEDNLEDFIRKNISVSMIGERWALPKSLHDKIKQVEEETHKKDTKQLELMLAICYAGTTDIVEATRGICEKVKNGVIEPNDVDKALVDQELCTRGLPHPDLLIRTGGRLRISDYLMWQLAQTELYFTHICAPEFQEAEFIQALHSFQERERTFGK
ncbi:Dehydrodolichyl diphosphate synthase 2 [Bienertia sinuspersici]